MQTTTSRHRNEESFALYFQTEMQYSFVSWDRVVYLE